MPFGTALPVNDSTVSRAAEWLGHQFQGADCDPMCNSGLIMTPVEFAQIISPFATAVVAGVAIWASDQQNKRTLGLSERQVRIEEAKVRSELFDRRYDAWMDLRTFAENRYKAVLSLNPTDKAADAKSREDQDGFQHAAERLFFLFGDDVHQAVIRLNGLLTAFHVATITERTANNYQAQILLSGQTLNANQACCEALDMLKLLVKNYMRPSV
jgi:Flp pilus assembly protein TadB